MPFQSEAQRRYLYARHPEIAKRWAAEYPNQRKLPDHVKKQNDHEAKKHILMRALGHE